MVLWEQNNKNTKFLVNYQYYGFMKTEWCNKYWNKMMECLHLYGQVKL